MLWKRLTGSGSGRNVSHSNIDEIAGRDFARRLWTESPKCVFCLAFQSTTDIKSNSNEMFLISNVNGESQWKHTANEKRIHCRAVKTARTWLFNATRISDNGNANQILYVTLVVRRISFMIVRRFFMHFVCTTRRGICFVVDAATRQIMQPHAIFVCSDSILLSDIFYYRTAEWPRTFYCNVKQKQSTIVCTSFSRRKYFTSTFQSHSNEDVRMYRPSCFVPGCQCAIREAYSNMRAYI